ncbi:MAG: PAS domain-containing protein [Rhodospirillales bacterium]|nr:PAS domain-containing protein [Rhodospirillales bacterium]MBO6786372.1 PAS domain-containing protein [Rhodospirillales bacterium]
MKFQILSRTQQYQELSQIQPPALLELYRKWDRSRGRSDLPRQQDISPSNLSPFAGNIALVNLETNPKCARYLHVGSNLKRLLGKDPTNLTVENIYSATVAKEIYEAFGKTVRARDATFYQRTFVILGRPYGYFRLILPMRLEGDQVSRLLIGIYPSDERMVDARSWLRAVNVFKQRKREFEESNPRTIGQVWESSLNQ